MITRQTFGARKEVPQVQNKTDEQLGKQRAPALPGHKDQVVQPQ